MPSARPVQDLNNPFTQLSAFAAQIYGGVADTFTMTAKTRGPVVGSILFGIYAATAGQGVGWEDSAFPSAFPHFGTVEYWETETRDLEEHVTRILSGDDEVPPGLQREKEVRDIELSNKDFFWDM